MLYSVILLLLLLFLLLILSDLLESQDQVQGQLGARAATPICPLAMLMSRTHETRSDKKAQLTPRSARDSSAAW